MILILNILFSNMAWAVDECSLTFGFSTQTLTSLNTDLITDYSYNEQDQASENYCNTPCVGWTHLNYVDYAASYFNINKEYNRIAPAVFIYYFNAPKPIIEPPKV